MTRVKHFTLYYYYYYYYTPSLNGGHTHLTREELSEKFQRTAVPILQELYIPHRNITLTHTHKCTCTPRQPLTKKSLYNVLLWRIAIITPHKYFLLYVFIFLHANTRGSTNWNAPRCYLRPDRQYCHSSDFRFVHTGEKHNDDGDDEPL